MMYVGKQTLSHNDMRNSVHFLAAAARRPFGFTLVELMVGLAILGILTAIAVPSLRQFLVRSAFDSAVIDMRAAVGRARVEAIARGTVVTFAPQIAGDWTSGFEVFVDPMQRGVFTVADVIGAGTDVRAAERLLVGAVPLASSVAWPTTSSSAAPRALYFMFNHQGQPVSPTGILDNSRLPVCISSSIQATNNCREIVVDRVGRIRVNPYTKSI